jgi:hypothetical protein
MYHGHCHRYQQTCPSKLLNQLGNHNVLVVLGCLFNFVVVFSVPTVGYRRLTKSYINALGMLIIRVSLCLCLCWLVLVVFGVSLSNAMALQNVLGDQEMIIYKPIQTNWALYDLYGAALRSMIIDNCHGTSIIDHVRAHNSISFSQHNPRLTRPYHNSNRGSHAL